MPLMNNVGLSIRESLTMVADILHAYGLRDRIRLICSSKLITPSGVAWALCVRKWMIEDQPYDVVAVGAHPDDVEIACGGTLAKLVRQGYRVAVIGTEGPSSRMAASALATIEVGD